MGFITFSLAYYAKELQRLESSAPTRETVYHAKQLLKMLDDLLDEGYTELNEVLEASCRGASRLRRYITDNGAEPFPVFRKAAAEAELVNAIDELIASAKQRQPVSGDGFLTEMADFCRWIGYEENTAYVFLLRDTLLPYVYYRGKDRANIHPWLLGRSTLTQLTGNAHADDEIRASIIKALELNQCGSHAEFCETVLPDIRATLEKYPEAKNRLAGLLDTIPQRRVVVIESGCSGTFPMLLKSLDQRVDIRMYTTYRYLLSAYGHRIYSAKYEQSRRFETLYAQDLYFQFSALRDNRFLCQAVPE